MAKLTIDGKAIEVEDGTNLIQACEMAGAEIPRFCYHDRLSIAGNCRMCLVEMERAPKPVASCAMPVADGMIVYTNTPTVKKAREGVMEFLLANHPLDCPICDQGGECDLQDQAMAYGVDRSRFSEDKRAVEDKYMGPLIKTHMNRCIHCTRCVRFSEEVAGVPEMGALGRGGTMEITTYLEKALASELSANVIDLCPVGALTSKPYAFKARPWELEHTESIDVLDAVGSHIRVDSRGDEVMRILPRLCEDVNEEWISDKTRYACDGLNKQRLDRPYIRIDGKLRPASWDQALRLVAQKMKAADPKRMAALAGDMVECESMFLLQQLVTGLGSPHLDCRQDGVELPTPKAATLFNTTIAGIEEADALLLIGTNPRWEAPLVNARLRKRFGRGKYPVALIGPELDLTYPHAHLGKEASILTEIANGTHSFAEALKTAQKPMIVLGMGVFQHVDAEAILHTVFEMTGKYGVVADGWNGYNVLHTAAARVGGLELGFVPQKGGLATNGIVQAACTGDLQVLYLLGADEVDLTGRPAECFVIYQGHHGDRGAQQADVVLPGAAYTEKDGTYVNLEGRVQRGYQAVTPPGAAKPDWKILCKLAEVMKRSFNCTSLADVRAAMVEASAALGRVGKLLQPRWPKTSFGVAGPIGDAPFTMPVGNFYMTDAISRHSPTMAACTAEFVFAPKKQKQSNKQRMAV